MVITDTTEEETKEEEKESTDDTTNKNSFILNQRMLAPIHLTEKYPRHAYKEFVWIDGRRVMATNGHAIAITTNTNIPKQPAVLVSAHLLKKLRRNLGKTLAKAYLDADKLRVEYTGYTHIIEAQPLDQTIHTVDYPDIHKLLDTLAEEQQAKEKHLHPHNTFPYRIAASASLITKVMKVVNDFSPFADQIIFTYYEPMDAFYIHATATANLTLTLIIMPMKESVH